MKGKVFLFFAVVTLVLVGCSKEKDIEEEMDMTVSTVEGVGQQPAGTTTGDNNAALSSGQSIAATDQATVPQPSSPQDVTVTTITAEGVSTTAQGTPETTEVQAQAVSVPEAVATTANQDSQVSAVGSESQSTNPAVTQDATTVVPAPEAPSAPEASVAPTALATGDIQSSTGTDSAPAPKVVVPSSSTPAVPGNATTPEGSKVGASTKPGGATEVVST